MASLVAQIVKNLPAMREVGLKKSDTAERVTHTYTHTNTHTHRGINGIMSKENRSQLKEFPRAQTGTF